MVTGSRLMGCGELWKVPTEPHLVEAAEVILTHLGGFEDSVALHVVQWCTQQIGTLHLFTRLHMVTGHLSLSSHCLRPWLIFLSHHAPQNCDSLSSTPPWSLCCQALVEWCWGQSLQFSCWDGPSLPQLWTQRNCCCFHSQTPQPHGRILQLSCHWSHPIVSCHLPIHPPCLNLHPCHLSLHPPHLSLHLPHHLSHHLPGIQCQPHCHSLSQRPGLILSGSLVSRCWQ